jgi:peptidoglycan-associated lipoprotein
MYTQHRQIAILTLLVCGLVVLAACGKKRVASAPPPPTPGAVAPTAQITAAPETVKAGETVQLTWKTENATEIEIDGMGAVDAEGSRSETPQESTAYRLIAKGPGGQTEAVAHVTVSSAEAGAATESDRAAFDRLVHPVFFDFDKYEIREDQKSTLAANVDFLTGKKHLRVVIEGYADERGSIEYNLALGESRAQTVRQMLVRDGVNPESVKVISYGKERQFCTESNEACWQQNRRAQFGLSE